METASVEENTILAQSTKAGEEVFENDVFKVTVAKKPTTTTTTSEQETDTQEPGDEQGE